MKQYRQGDRITFSFEGVTYPYEIRDTHLSIFDDSGINSKILSKLGYTTVDKRWKYASQIYGYECRGGSWPSYAKGDMVAASMIIEAVKDKCRGQAKYTGHMYKRGDRVEFTVAGETVKYEVGNTFLSEVNGGKNQRILELLGMHTDDVRWDYCEKFYGYPCRSGAWPSYKNGDCIGITRVIDDLHSRCRDYVTPITIKGDRYISDAVRGDYFYSITEVDEHSRLEGSIVRLIEDVYEDDEGLTVVRYDGIEGNHKRSTNEYPEDNFRYATHEEILASKYANEYKSLIGGDLTKSVNYEVQVKSKAVSTRHRGEAVKPRRSAVKITSASGLTGNPITSFTRRSKIGHGKVSTSFLVASRH